MKVSKLVTIAPSLLCVWSAYRGVLPVWERVTRSDIFYIFAPERLTVRKVLQSPQRRAWCKVYAFHKRIDQVANATRRCSEGKSMV